MLNEGRPTMQWMLMPLKRYADFEGRSRRTEYWMFTLFVLIIYAVLAAIMFLGGDIGEMESGASPMPPGFWIGLGLFALFALAMLIPSIAVQVRRFHDQDRSGWMVLLGFIPYVGGLIVLVFMCLEGTHGPNAYGADPKDPDGEYEAAALSLGAQGPPPRGPGGY